MSPAWVPVFVLPIIGLGLVILGIRFMNDHHPQAALRRMRGGVCIVIGIVLMVVAGLIGAFMSV
ncbi:hypothetical protein ACQBAU_09690 [Propionibacteriaceae bacterium Y2011]|uniref:hypothetical protein n=1 Tax=Microlunatus sp. Y2014 TaxID=3418488 RepID=UPI003B4C6446